MTKLFARALREALVGGIPGTGSLIEVGAERCNRRKGGSPAEAIYGQLSTAMDSAIEVNIRTTTSKALSFICEITVRCRVVFAQDCFKP